jgi:hypothetical protein
MSKIIDLSFLDEIRDVTDSADDNKVIEAYEYYKTRERHLGKKEQYYLQCLEKEMRERNLKATWEK